MNPGRPLHRRVRLGKRYSALCPSRMPFWSIRTVPSSSALIRIVPLACRNADFLRQSHPLKDVSYSSDAARMFQILCRSDDRVVEAGVKFEDCTQPRKPKLSTLRLDHRCWSNCFPTGENGRVERVAPFPFSRLLGTSGRRAVESVAPRRSFDDVVLPPATRRALGAALAQVTQHDLIFKCWGLEDRHSTGLGLAFNFAGPPGTGKTICAEAIAQSLGRQLLVVRYAELESMWMGETSKNVAAIFRTAREEQAVLLFDEADAIAGRRSTSVDSGPSANRIVVCSPTGFYDKLKGKPAKREFKRHCDI